MFSFSHSLLSLPLVLLLLYPHQAPAVEATQQSERASAITTTDKRDNDAPSIFYPPSSSGYVYYGCYNETTELPDTVGVRALHDGTNLVQPDSMTVEMCLDFCRTGAGDANGGKTGRFQFAGLEYSRYVMFNLLYRMRPPSGTRQLVEMGALESLVSAP